MLQKKSYISSWGIGLSSEQAALLGTSLSDDHRLILKDFEDLPALLDSAEEHPCILWISSRLGARLCKLSPGERQGFDQVCKAFLLEEQYVLSDFENACDLGVTEIVRPPYARERIAEIIRRALEVQAIHHDLNCMAREILLERELLERKNELLSFLVHFFTNTTQSQDLKGILQSVHTGLARLLPLRSMHVALWDKEGTNPHSVSLYICAPEYSMARNLWRDALLKQVRHTVGSHFSLMEIQKLHLHNLPDEWADTTPEDGIIMHLPIINSQEQLGILMLLTSMERHLGRDQAVALDLAMRHFAVCIKNTPCFQRKQIHADYKDKGLLPLQR